MMIMMMPETRRTASLFEQQGRVETINMNGMELLIPNRQMFEMLPYDINEGSKVEQTSIVGSDNNKVQNETNVE